MRPEALPLQELFTQLRQALPLGIREYELALHALQHGFGTLDREALARMCQRLWIKSEDEQRIFRYHFNLVVPQTLDSTPKRDTPSPAPPIEGSPERPKKEADTPPASPQNRKDEQTTPATPALTADDEIEVAQAVRHTGPDEEPLLSDVIVIQDYLPVTRRQMKQSWRHLRRPIREGPPIELDIPATVQRVGRDGMLTAPVLVPRRRNRSELLFLLDQEGSMVPFHALARRLVETAERGGRLRRVGRYYFHNCPLEHLYDDPHLRQAEPLNKIWPHLHPLRTAVLIFSDAGAARHSLNPERWDLTQQFLEQLLQRTQRVAWLNPMPRTRWSETTAAQIADIVPMFTAHRQGLDDAIDILRGRFSRL